MKFNWNGELLSKIPKWANKRYNDWENLDKNTKNTFARARYHDNKAIERYNAAGDDFKDIPISDVFKHRNSDRRRRLINHFGIENVLKPYKQTIIDKKTVNNLPYELVQITIPLEWSEWKNGMSINHSERLCTYLKMINPTTGEYHLEGVATKSDQQWDHIADLTVKSALAWRDGENKTSRTFNSNNKFSDYAYIEPEMLT